MLRGSNLFLNSLSNALACPLSDPTIIGLPSYWGYNHLPDSSGFPVPAAAVSCIVVNTGSAEVVAAHSGPASYC